MTTVVTLSVTVVAALLAYVFGVRQELRSRLHAERIDATTAFCRALMDYRGAQIARWHAGGDDAPDALAAAVRSTRSAAWAAYFHVALVVDDPGASAACRRALDATTELKREASAESLDEAGEKVRDLTEEFVGRVADKLGVTIPQPASRQRSGANQGD
jgi:hypothetical protein